MTYLTVPPKYTKAATVYLKVKNVDYYNTGVCGVLRYHFLILLARHFDYARLRDQYS